LEKKEENPPENGKTQKALKDNQRKKDQKVNKNPKKPFLGVRPPGTQPRKGGLPPKMSPGSCKRIEFGETI